MFLRLYRLAARLYVWRFNRQMRGFERPDSWNRT